MRDHGGRWQIEHTEELDAWTAVRNSPDGRHIRVLVARDPASLRGKLETVEAENPAPATRRVSPGWISGPCTWAAGGWDS
jgi:hypothetical protein